MKKASIKFPPHIDLARLPTPIKPLQRLGEKLGIELYIKRDDLTGFALSGNKIRKLEFVMADAIHQHADTVLTCGGAQSNHARATAVAAARLGLQCRLLLRTPDPSDPPPPEGNILLDCMAGAEIVWITPDEYKHRNQIFEREADSLREFKRRPYIIPEGASNALGTWGYIRAMEELAADIASLPNIADQPVTIINPAGSGGTTAGLILGAKLLGVNARIVSFNVCDDRDYFMEVIGKICESAISDFKLNLPFARERDIEIIEGYVGSGYALSQPQELKLLCEIARAEGIFLDPVYTVKAFFGMVSELKRNPARFGERIIFIHTGGIFGLFPVADQIASLL